MLSLVVTTIRSPRGWRRMLFMLCMVLAAPDVFADCTFYPGYSLQNMTINLPTVIVPRDAAPGTVLASAETPTTAGTGGGAKNSFATCTAPGNSYYAVNGAQTTSAGGLSDVFATNVPGIGLRVYIRTVQGGTSYRFTTPGVNAGSSVGDWGWYKYGNSWWGVQVISTGQISSGQTDGKISATVTLDNLLVTQITIPSFQVISQACVTPDVIVPMGQHLPSELAGGFTASVGFNISLNSCPAGMNSIQYRIDPMTAVLNSAQSVVALDSSSTATGVGVQLLDGTGAVFPISTLQTFSGYNPSSGGNYTIPMRARYYRTGTITPGPANTSMTITMQYQ
jgi:major type 1 subunit fimbrin (pilin)